MPVFCEVVFTLDRCDSAVSFGVVSSVVAVERCHAIRVCGSLYSGVDGVWVSFVPSFAFRVLSCIVRQRFVCFLSLSFRAKASNSWILSSRFGFVSVGTDVSPLSSSASLARDSVAWLLFSTYLPTVAPSSVGFGLFMLSTSTSSTMAVV